MEAFSLLACSESISIVHYVSLILYFFAISTPGCYNISLIAKRISEGDSLDNLNPPVWSRPKSLHSYYIPINL